MSMTVQEMYALCDGCAAEVNNGDDSARDFDDIGDGERESRDNAIASMGVVCHVGTGEYGGNFNCYVCDEPQYGSPQMFERV